MKIIIGNNDQTLEVKNITVVVEDIEYRISVNQFDELVLNKGQFGDGESTLIVKPSVSNEIRIK